LINLGISRLPDTNYLLIEIIEDHIIFRALQTPFSSAMRCKRIQKILILKKRVSSAFVMQMLWEVLL
jgi:hypothetical protein